MVHMLVYDWRGRNWQPPQCDAVSPDEEQYEYLPVRVQVALRFIDRCNEHMGLRGFPGNSIAGEETVVQEQELHPKQEAVFAIACNVVGQFLAEELRE